MNLPNKLTCLRVLLIPVFVLLYMGANEKNLTYYYLATAVFALASLTDMLDGMIARKYNLITNFGKFMDPLADKLLVSAALILLTAEGMIPPWITIVIISREFVISGFRLVAADEGVVIAASYFGKFKTVFQMLMTLVMISHLPFTFIYPLGKVLMWISLVLTVVSLIDYLIKNKDVMLKGGL